MAKRDGFDKSFQLRVNDDFLEMIDAWMGDRGHDWSRSEAIRTLVSMGTKINTGSQDHVNEAIQDYRNLNETIIERLSITAEDVATVEGAQSVAGELVRSLREIEEADQKLADFVDDRNMLRGQLAQFRSEMLKTLATVQSTADHLISIRQKRANVS